ncbi:MAG: EAL domain-containing protein, partial [Gammaproteobacteria bacterium]
KDIPNNSNDAVITETIIGMSHHLNLRVIAEGVETSLQLDFLTQRGCHAYQGFYFSKPISAIHYAEKYLCNASERTECSGDKLKSFES